MPLLLSFKKQDMKIHHKTDIRHKVHTGLQKKTINDNQQQLTQAAKNKIN